MLDEVLREINAAGMEFTVHTGDIKSGSSRCDDVVYTNAIDLFNTFHAPMIYVPGDNEWTDCHKAAQGGGTFNPSTGQIDFVLDASGNPVDYANGDPLANLGRDRHAACLLAEE